MLFNLFTACSQFHKKSSFFGVGQFCCNFDLILIDDLQSILAEFYERFGGN